MTVSQNLDSLRFGLLTAKGLAWQAGGNYSEAEFVAGESKPTGAEDAVSIASQSETADGFRQDFHETVRQALQSVQRLGLPASETQPLKTALESALREDDLGVFERMQLQAGWQGALQQLEQKAEADDSAISADARFQRAASASESSEQRQGRIERYVDRAIDVLTELETRHGDEDTEIAPWTPPASDAPAPSAPDVVEPTSAAPSETPPASVLPTVPTWTPNPSNPYQNGWTGNAGTVAVSPATGWTPSPSTSGDVNALVHSVWGDRGKKKSPAELPSGLSPSTGNLYSDYLLDRGSFTPKKDDKEDEEG